MKNTHKLSISALVLIPALLSAQTVLIDFSGDDSDPTTGNWNNAINPGLGVTGGYPLQLIDDLVDNAGNATGITLNVTDGFHGRNTAGTTSSALYPSTATSDSWYTANSSWDPASGDGILDNGFGIIEFTGLDSNKTYDFTMFASRTDAAASNRETEYAFSGSNDVSVFLDAHNNVTGTVTASSISPTAGGIITLTVSATDNNSTTQDFAYLGVMEMAVIPEPGTFALLLGAMATGLVMLRRRS